MTGGHTSAVLDLRELQWASQQNVATSVLLRRPGVVEVAVNPVAQTATVVFDPAVTSVGALRQWVRDCGYHCDGQSVPKHICDPEIEPHAEHKTSATHEAPSSHEAHQIDCARSRKHPGSWTSSVAQPRLPFHRNKARRVFEPTLIRLTRTTALI